ncbi:hypothetical protein [Roseovarius indicus]|uniref:hypothetical protein n=1 Tax=Roseovarius indicus TaxID=540747 RepID=UPI0007D9749B|nr:hypothetical protein [Roseovarius indicus]OAO01532.1 hypothetical protein A8B76_19375 [Roseovarius indicus]
MDRLAIYLAVLIGSCVAGGLLIAAFALDYYSIWAFVVCGVIGLIAAYPAGYWVSRYIKRNDPDFNHRKPRQSDGILPDPKAPEI